MARHHLVPRMLLRRFADQDERIVMVGRDAPHKVVPTSVGTAAAEVGFYRIDTDDVADGHQEGHDPEAVEHALGAIESTAKPLLDELVAGRFPSLEDRFRVSMFVALQAVRGQGFRQEMERMATLAARTWWSTNVTDAEIRERLKEAGRSAGAADVRAYREEAVREGGWTLRMSQPHAVQETLKHGLETVMPMIYFRAWRLLRFKAPVLLTSDAPVATWSPPRPDALPVGIANAREVYLPLDRRTALVVTDKPFDEDAAEPVVHARNSRAVRVKTAVAQGAHRWLFHHPEDRPLDRITIGPRTRWEEETVPAALDDDGTVRVRKMYVKRPLGDQERPAARAQDQP